MTLRIAVLALAIAALAAGPAAAASPPVHDQVEIHNPQRDNGEHCGFPVLWDIHISADRYRWYDDQGRITRQVSHIREDNTVQNLETGKTLRDGPVNFVRVTRFENGVAVRATDTGVMVNIRDGRDRLLDAGSISYRVHPDGRWEIFGGVGPHPVYRALDGNQFIAALGAFCGVLD